MSFLTKCQHIPPPGGAGCHPALLGAANAGVREDLDDATIFHTIRTHVPPGAREVPDREIWDTIRTARADNGTVPRQVSKAFQIPPAIRGPELRALLAAQSTCTTGAELRSLSRAEIPSSAVLQFGKFVDHLYCKTDKLFVGPELSASREHIYSVLQLCSLAAPSFKFIINPLTGETGLTRDGLKNSYRCDSVVAKYRYMLIEMDGVPLGEQTRIWTTIVRDELLPVAAVYYSGGKSLHALITLENVESAADWDDVVRNNFYPRIAQPLGADSQCKNPSRFSRVPGAQEEGRGVQWLLYLGANETLVRHL